MRQHELSTGPTDIINVGARRDGSPRTLSVAVYTSAGNLFNLWFSLLIQAYTQREFNTYGCAGYARLDLGISETVEYDTKLYYCRQQHIIVMHIIMQIIIMGIA